MLTVAQLAAHLAPNVGPAERARIIRKVRHWTTSGALETSGELHGGTGKHRVYPEPEVFKAALLLELSRYNLPVGWMIQAGRILKSVSRLGGKNWGPATRGEKTVYFAFSARPTDHGKIAGQGFLCDASELRKVVQDHVLPSSILINLTLLFARLAT